MRPKSVLLFEARRALHMSRQQVGDAIGWSLRTIVRWESGKTDVYSPSLLKLVPLVHPIDVKLAEELAQAGGMTLAQMGIGAQAAPPEPPISPLHLADSIVCVAADALKAAPEAARPAVLASFRRARELRMSVHEVEHAMMLAMGLTGDAPSAAPQKKGKPRDG
jgi:transcriptional regulator with XRE-family HTH domain